MVEKQWSRHQTRVGKRYKQAAPRDSKGVMDEEEKAKRQREGPIIPHENVVDNRSNGLIVNVPLLTPLVVHRVVRERLVLAPRFDRSDRPSAWIHLNTPVDTGGGGHKT